jgi:hypothetical protein
MMSGMTVPLGDLKMKKTYMKPVLLRREVLSKVTAQELPSGQQDG